MDQPRSRKWLRRSLVLLGLLTLLIGVTGALYAEVSYRVFDIRTSFSLAIGTALLVTITAMIVFVALYVTNTLNLRNDTEGNILMATISLAVSLVLTQM